MSDENLIRAKGQQLHDHQRCRERLRALESEAERTAKMLDGVVAFLRGTRKEEGFSSSGLEEILTGQLITRMTELHATRDKQGRLRRLVDID
jgi:hypothetical protein